MFDFEENTDEQVKAILDKAHYSSYRLITGKVTFEDLLEYDYLNGETTVMVHDPENPITPELVDSLILYFEGKEDYEICAELKKVLDEKTED
jgi:hypothetical protein